MGGSNNNSFRPQAAGLLSFDKRQKKVTKEKRYARAPLRERSLRRDFSMAHPVPAKNGAPPVRRPPGL
ncbi:hypothetical protein, partial [Lysobacter silvisoli]|uniref:hypothetical protein n=1 Tax=Lysobacter silvisoli TaxID=2293254 RepID=UPI001E4059EC